MMVDGYHMTTKIHSVLNNKQEEHIVSTKQSEVQTELEVSNILAIDMGHSQQRLSGSELMSISVSV